MKSQTMSFAMVVAVASTVIADTLRIGTFTLPYRIEDTNITDIVRHVVTNDVIYYDSAITSFTPPFVEKDGNVTVNGENTPDTTLYRPQVFRNGIEFRIVNGQTNCIIRQSLTDAAKAIENELPTRTNLVAGAEAFIANFSSGATTNLAIREQRKIMRTIKDDQLLDMEDDSSDQEVVEIFDEMCRGFTFLPICVLDTEYSNIGTNRAFWAYVRTDMPNKPSHAHSIEALPLVFAEGRWSFLY